MYDYTPVLLFARASVGAVSAERKYFAGNFFVKRFIFCGVNIVNKKLLSSIFVNNVSNLLLVFTINLTTLQIVSYETFTMWWL